MHFASVTLLILSSDYSDYNFKNQDFIWFKGYGQAKLVRAYLRALSKT